MSPEDYVPAPRATRHRYWLHLLLLLATLLTTTIVGARMHQDFRANLPPAGVEEIWETFSMLSLPGDLPLLFDDGFKVTTKL